MNAIFDKSSDGQEFDPIRSCHQWISYRFDPDRCELQDLYTLKPHDGTVRDMRFHGSVTLWPKTLLCLARHSMLSSSPPLFCEKISPPQEPSVALIWRCRGHVSCCRGYFDGPSRPSFCRPQRPGLFRFGLIGGLRTCIFGVEEFFLSSSGFDAQICAVSVHEDTVATASLDATVRLWDVRQGWLVHEWMRKKGRSTVFFHNCAYPPLCTSLAKCLQVVQGRGAPMTAVDIDR